MATPYKPGQILLARISGKPQLLLFLEHKKDKIAVIDTSGKKYALPEKKIIHVSSHHIPCENIEDQKIGFQLKAVYEEAQQLAQAINIAEIYTLLKDEVNSEGFEQFFQHWRWKLETLQVSQDKLVGFRDGRRTTVCRDYHLVAQFKGVKHSFEDATFGSDSCYN